MIYNAQGIEGQIRQGDLLIEKTQEDVKSGPVEKDSIKDNRFIIAEGDSLPLAHFLEADKAEIKAFADRRFIEVKSPTEVKHEGTHDPLPLNHNSEIIEQREWRDSDSARVSD